MVAFVWLLPFVGLAGLLFAVRWSRQAALAQASAIAVSTVAVIVYVAGEDDYRGGGVSRWEAYDARALTVSAVSVGIAAVVGLVAASATDRRALGVTAFVVSAVAAALQFAAVLANSLN